MLPESISNSIETPETEEISALLSARTLKINGHTMSIEMAGERTLHIRNASFDPDAERAYNIPGDDRTFSNAFATAWMGIANGQYRTLLPDLHLYQTWEELCASPLGITAHAGYVLKGANLPEEWKARFVELPRQEDGVFALEFVCGKLKITREMHNSHYVEGEWAGYNGPKHQRNAFYKHLAIRILALGTSVNVHYFGEGKYVNQVVTKTVDLPIAERIAVANESIARNVVGNAERNIGQYVERLAGQGKTFASGLRHVKLANGQVLSDAELIGKSFLRWSGNIYLGELGVTEKNVENFLHVVGKCQLSLVLNDGSYDLGTGKPK